MARLCKTCGEDPCQCLALREREAWIIRYCATPGCGVRIREMINNQGAKTCKWCQAGTKYAQQKADKREEGE